MFQIQSKISTLILELQAGSRKPCLHIRGNNFALFQNRVSCTWAGLEPLSAPGPGVRQNMMTEREYKEELLTS